MHTVGRSNGKFPSSFLYSNGEATIRLNRTQNIMSFSCSSMRKQGQTKEAEKLHHLMVRAGVKPSVVSYRILLLGYANDGTVDDVMNILERMKRNHVVPDYSTYTSLIKAFAQNRKVDGAMCVLERMKQEGVMPDLSAYSPILKLLLQMRCDDDARDLVNQAISKMND